MIDDSILELLQKSFSPSVQSIYVPALGKPLNFRESTVKEQKTVSKVVASNADRQSVIYASTLAMIRNLCMEDLDVGALTEFDRTKIMAFLFSMNFFSKRLTMTCPKCKKPFAYTVMHGELLKGLDKVATEDIAFKADNRIGSIEVTLNFPSCSRYLDFLETMDRVNDVKRHDLAKNDKSYDAMNHAFDGLDKVVEAQTENGGKHVSSDDVRIAEMIRKRKGGGARRTDGVAQKKEDDSDVSFVTLLDAADLYIRRIRYHVNGSDDDVDIDFSGYGFEDTERILGKFPVVMFTDDVSGRTLMSFIRDEFRKRLSVAVPHISCPNDGCGYDIGKRLQLHDFFLFG